MPIRAYFETRQTRVTIPGGLAGNGISVTGPVLEGRMSVDEALVLSWIRSSAGAVQTVTTAQAGVTGFPLGVLPPPPGPRGS